jgi:hypothetical protein
VPAKTDPLDVLHAIATDLLAQAEAQHRTATRLEQTAREFSRGVSVHDRASVRPPFGMLRGHLRAMRDLFEAERGLLEELERELSMASSRS